MEQVARGLHRRVVRHRLIRSGQPSVVIQAKAEQLGVQQESGDAGMGLELARHGADQVLLRLGDLLLGEPLRDDCRQLLIDRLRWSARRSPRDTPARIMSGPGPTLASSELKT